MKLLIIFALLSSFLFAQYTNEDYELVKTTFKREFDKKIILDYLQSGNSKKISAAILAISHSNDLSFIDEIVKLNFNEFGNEISFALGQLGESEASAKFLIEQLEKILINNENESIHSNKILEALGKTGGKKLLSYFTPGYPDDISPVIYQFYLREYLNKDSAVILINNQLQKDFTPYAEFALYRIGPNEKSLELLEDHYKNSGSDFSIHFLGSFRKLKQFPSLHNFNSVVKNVLNSKYNNLAEAAETVKILSYYNYKNIDELNSFIELLNHQNKNIALQGAISLKDITVPAELKKEFQKVLKKYLLDKSLLPQRIRKEFLFSYYKLFSPGFEDIRKEFNNLDDGDFILIAGESISSEKAFNLLIKEFEEADAKAKTSLLPQLIKFKNDKLDDIFLAALSSSSPALISISSESINKDLIDKNKSKLKEIIISQLNNYKNEPDYIESIVSLYSLSEKIDSSITQNALEIIASSSLYSNQKFTYEKLGLDVSSLIKDDSMFDIFWSSAFKYKSAIIKTSKGDIQINFRPDAAPISVGSFCYLAAKGFYNEIEFHRVVPGFVIQAGDPAGTGWGGPGYEIISEYSHLEFYPDMVGMASAGKDTEGSQFFITTGYYPHLNSRYTIFAEVINGKPEIIEQGDKIISIELIE